MKKGNKTAANILIVAGGVLILAASVLYIHNLHEDQKAGSHADLVIPMLEAEISAKKEEGKPSDPELKSEELGGNEEAFPKTDMTEIMVEGKNYIGYLTIPALELVLPVMSDWSYPDLKLAPCRQYGSVYTDDLVIAGHNYQRHFGRLDELLPGDDMEFTDMDGETFSYQVGEVSEIAADDVELVENSPWDLVLYTCTPGGKKRVMIGMEKIGN